MYKNVLQGGCIKRYPGANEIKHKIWEKALKMAQHILSLKVHYFVAFMKPYK